MPKEQRFRGHSKAVEFDPKVHTKTADTRAYEPRGSTATSDAMRRIAAGMEERYRPLVSAFASWSEAFHRDDMRDIARENKRQEEQGAADAAMGREAALENDLDYMNVYDRVLAQKDALSDAAEFQGLAATWGDDVNAEAARGEFFKGKMGDGTGRNTYDFFYADAFNRRTEETVTAHKMAQIKLTYKRGLDNLAQVAAAEAQTGAFSVESIRKLERDATVMHHGDEVAARQFVWNTLSANAKTPDALHKLSVAIYQKGYGPNGESFADLFPHTAHDISEKATNDYLNGMTIEGHEAYQQIEEVFLNPDTVANKDHFGGAILALEAIRNRHGGESKYNAIKRDIVDVLQKQAETLAGVNRLNMKIGSPSSVQLEPEDVTKYGDDVLTANGIATPQADPQQAMAAGVIVSQLGATPPGIKKTMDAAMGNINDPVGIASAYTFYDTIMANGGDIELSGNARTIFFGIKALKDATGVDTEVALQQFLGNPAVRDALTKPGEVKWNELQGKPDDKNSEVRGEVVSKVRAGFGQKFDLGKWYAWDNSGGDNVVIDGKLQEEIMGAVAGMANTYVNSGIADPVGKAVEAITQSDRYIAVPIADGKFRIERNDLPKEYNGKPVYGPGLVYNPATGQTENTVDNFNKQMTTVTQILPGLFGDEDAAGNPQKFTVAKDELTKAQGVFKLRKNGMPFYIDAGTEFTYKPGGADSIDEKLTSYSTLQWLMPDNSFGAILPQRDKPTTLSTDPKQAAAQLEAILPENFVVIPHEFNGKWAFEIGYEFGLEESLPTIEQRMEDYKP